MTTTEPRLATFSDSPAVTLNLPVPPNRVGELLPDEVATLWSEVLKIRTAADLAATAYSQALAALESAMAADVADAADAIRTGKGDPTTTANETAARAKIVETRRTAEATYRARLDAGDEMLDALRRIDRTALAADYQARHDATQAQARDALAVYKAARAEAYLMAALVEWVANTPSPYSFPVNAAGPYDQMQRLAIADLEVIARAGRNRPGVIEGHFGDRPDVA
jgi:hypothetical protein